MLDNFENLTKRVISCRRCERLVQYRETVPARASFKEQIYWRKPVPGFGDPNAWLLILGLAPAAHGGNRTGRIFTGDESGQFLMRVLYKEGFANQPYSHSKDDGLILKGCYITAMVKCAPPQNKPTNQECLNCSSYLLEERDLLKNVKAVFALGQFAFEKYANLLRKEGHQIPRLKFQHGRVYPLEGLPTLYANYHPSQQNTFTGLLTEAMFSDVLKRIKLDLGF